jgi:peptidoglycan/xylan/chitin deacetylase (PgdA/CDA1 family)
VSDNGLHPVEALLQPRWDVRLADTPDEEAARRATVTCRPGKGERAWLRSDEWRIYTRVGEGRAVGEKLAAFTREDGRAVHATIDASGAVSVPFSFADAHDAYVSEAWRQASSNRRLSPRSLDAFYRAKRLIPRPVQLAARRRLIRAQGVPSFPAWPSDTSISSLSRFFAACTLRAAGLQNGEFVWFWPEKHRAAVILTHDVESVDGIGRVLELADLEEAHGFRSSFNFGAWYQIDPGILRELVSRGFEVGMHGLTHDRQLFASRASFEERLPELRRLAERLGAVGFRSPATHRVFSWLAELPVEYDCTLPNSDPYEPQPGGCCSVWPFTIGPVVELPYTLPQDHTLLTLLGERTPRLWLDQAANLSDEFGLIQCVSHPDRGYLGDADKRAVYSAFLEGLAERDDLWRALPREVASWWRQRAAALDQPGDRLSTGTAVLVANGQVEFRPPAREAGGTRQRAASPDDTSGTPR